MDLGLFQQQTLKLVMTNELRQAITLLQYSAVELQEFVEEQALENPLIDLAEQASAAEPASMGGYSGRVRKSEQHNPFDFISSNETSLRDYLQEQVSYQSISGDIKKALSFLVDSLDENGYLSEPLETASAKTGVSMEDTEAALGILQTLEPAGVGARDLGECLLIQLKQLYPRQYLAEKVVSEHLQEFAFKKWRELAKKLDTDLQALQDVYDVVQGLNPRPGALYAGEKPRYIIPDITVRRSGMHYEIMMNDQYTPQININRQYQNYLHDDSKSEEAKYIQNKFQQMVWLIKSIEQRRSTLLRVMSVILERQEDFFELGPQHLKPMTLREVAEEADIHESTVSRAVKNKYVQTPHGLFELKYFFTAGLKTDSGAEASAEVVKEMVRGLIDKEDAKKPFSDQKLVEALQKEKGIVVSRRTIAKYREQMNIPSSSKRKRF